MRLPLFFLNTNSEIGVFVMTKLDLTQGKTPREQLELPPLYFVAMDDW